MIMIRVLQVKHPFIKNRSNKKRQNEIEVVEVQCHAISCAHITDKYSTLYCTYLHIETKQLQNIGILMTC